MHRLRLALGTTLGFALLFVTADVRGQTATAEMQPVAVVAGKVALMPENTLIQFTGTHAGSDPNPRVGVFQKFKGSADVQEGQLKSIAVDIETASLVTPIDKLTNHLKSPDFFDAREYPAAKFVSTDIRGSFAGKIMITGNLTIMGTTKQIQFPAEFFGGDDGIMLTGEVELDRTEFGMSKLTERVNKDVSLAVAIGKASKLAPSAGQGDGR